MDLAAYAAEAAVEESHWWFVVRRRLFSRIINSFSVDLWAPVLDVGTSTGTNLRMLKSLGFESVTGVDLSPEAVRYCDQKGLGSVRIGDACALPFDDNTFELALATDIIEHVDDDALALSELHRVLAKNGRVIMTVPAFPSLWGLQDEIAHHKRRYRYRSLLGVVERTGFTVLEAFHFNYLLFVPIWAARRMIDLASVNLQSENDLNSPWLNKMLTWIFDLDVSTARSLHPPFGVSILMVLGRSNE